MAFAHLQGTQLDRTLSALAIRLGPRKLSAFLLQWGVGTKAKAQTNAIAKGGRRLWREIARSVAVDQVSNDGVRVRATHPAAGHKHKGGPIEAPGKGPWAKGAQSLAIPLSGSPAEGRMPGEFKGMFRLPGTNVLAIKATNAMRDRSGRYIRRDKANPIVAMFVLVKKTKPQRANPWWPENAYVNRLGLKLAAQMLLEGGA